MRVISVETVRTHPVVAGDCHDVAPVALEDGLEQQAQPVEQPEVDGEVISTPHLDAAAATRA